MPEDPKLRTGVGKGPSNLGGEFDSWLESVDQILGTSSPPAASRTSVASPAKKDVPASALSSGAGGEGADDFYADIQIASAPSEPAVVPPQRPPKRRVSRNVIRRGEARVTSILEAEASPARMAAALAPVTEPAEETASDSDLRRSLELDADAMADFAAAAVSEEDGAMEGSGLDDSELLKIMSALTFGEEDPARLDQVADVLVTDWGCLGLGARVVRRHDVQGLLRVILERLDQGQLLQEGDQVLNGEGVEDLTVQGIPGYLSPDLFHI